MSLLDPMVPKLNSLAIVYDLPPHLTVVTPPNFQGIYAIIIIIIHLKFVVITIAIITTKVVTTRSTTPTLATQDDSAPFFSPNARIPIFCDPTTSHGRASMVINALDGYRKQLVTFMKCLDQMVHQRLPKWQGATHFPNVATKLQEKMWKDFLRIPELWEANEQALMELLQDPGDFMLGLENQITRDDSSNHGGNSTHEACGAWSSPEPNTTTTTSTSPGSMSYDDTFQLIIHLLRDWAPEGKEIREQSYGPILTEIDRLFPPSTCPHAISDSPQPKRVLIPGAGLGRLAYEVLRLGDHYHVVAVERSVLMTIALHNLLKHPVAPPSIFYPYLQDPLTNSPNHHRRFTASSFPDLTPVLLLPPERRRSTKEEEEEGGGRWYFSIENTDFTSLSQLPSIKGTFDVVATCYFIDTTVNVLDYLWAIRSALTDGGYWINLGPLKYHHTANEAVHLSLEELLIVAEELGFEVLQHQQLGATLYRPEVEVETIMKIEPFQPVFIVARLSSSPRPHTINQNSDGITRE